MGQIDLKKVSVKLNWWPSSLNQHLIHGIPLDKRGILEGSGTDRRQEADEMRDDVEVIPIGMLWLTPEQFKVKANEADVQGMKDPSNQQNYLVRVCRQNGLSTGQYAICGNLMDYLACRDAKREFVSCVVEGRSWMRELRETEDSMAWARLARSLKDAGYELDYIVDHSQLPRSVVLDRLATLQAFDQMAKAKADELALAEEHGRILGRAEYIQEKNEHRIIQEHLRKVQLGKCAACGKVMNFFVRGQQVCQACKKCLSTGELYRIGKSNCPGCGELRDNSVIQDGHCHTCKGKKTSPLERGKVLCLQPGCKVWIKSPAKRVRPLQASYYFCKAHQVMTLDNPQFDTKIRDDRFIYRSSTEVCRNLSNMPTFDRDGDPIWVTREVEVIKIKDMEDSHLTNCITFLEGAAKRRCQVTGVSEDRWTERTGFRYKYLVEEAKRRDAKLKCCNDGVEKAVIGHEGTTEVFCSCIVGRARQDVHAAAVRLKQQREGKKAIAAKVAVTMLTALLVGGQLQAGFHVVEWFIGYLRDWGIVR